ncbi:MAG: AmmeMemoRadiSam system radical SAM enzyme [Candidatus Cloacimonas sp. 4484_209]|nr:MAG: AmmeMemoRadiSam system radical SAM enzyme [Candidatus Cloacimonas sp. 4484_209]
MKKDLSRRDFIKSATAMAMATGVLLLPKKDVEAQELGYISPVEARHYKKLSNKVVQCYRCPNFCKLKPGERSFCRTRVNKNGKLYTYAYANPCAVHIDPVEKKPLFHFLPGTQILSIATAGCTFRCKYCQNWEISQFRPEETVNYALSPQEVVDLAIKYKTPSIASTYSEPTAFYEYMYDTSKLAHKREIRTTMHSNGSINTKPLVELCEYLDAANIDLKFFDDEKYKRISQGHFRTVLNTLKTLVKEGVHLEITNLLVPTLNDGEDEISEMSHWIMDNLGPDIPLHFSRFYPMYKLKNLPPTPVKTLEIARNIAMDAGLHYVYIGNVPGHPGENTYCPGCGKAVIKRTGYIITENNLKDGKCGFCGRKITGVWK